MLPPGGEADAGRWSGETPMGLVRGPVTLGYLVVVLFFVGLGAWAAFANIASATVARGVVSPEGSRKTIQHLEGGIITEILVNEGDRVEAGDPLVVLRGTQARASFEELQNKKYLFAAKLARLRSEQAGKAEVAFPDWLLAAAVEHEAVAELVQAQQDLFAARFEVHQGRAAIGNKRIDELREEIIGLEELIKSKRKQIKSLDEELAANQKLLDRDLIARPVYLQLDRLRSEIEGEMAESVANVARARQSIGETELQILNEGARRLDDITSELADTRAELAAINERLNAQLDILERTVITSPVAGVIHNKQFYTTGGVIRPGQPILDIVPDEVELLIEAHVSPVDIDVVAVGQEARVNFLSFSARNLPQIKGSVRSLSADSLLDEATGESYFRAFVQVPPEEIDKLGEALSINPGMPAELLIMTGERTMLEYLMYPLVESVRRSFREI
jgi:HlyD family secretion protein/epimerase transport system membrane fusion protein